MLFESNNTFFPPKTVFKISVEEPEESNVPKILSKLTFISIWLPLPYAPLGTDVIID